MRRLKIFVVASALLAGAFGASGTAHAFGSARTSLGCAPQTLWLFCGTHIPAKRLPLTFWYDGAGAPDGVHDAHGTDLTPAAIADAFGAWDTSWPVPATSCSPLCYGGTTTAPFGFDGRNTIVWDSPSKCGGGASALAITCIWTEAASGGGSLRIKEVDIILNPARAWAFPGATDPAVVAGDAIAVAPVLTDGWYDIASVLTHESGHAIGLGHIGDAQNPWPGQLEDSGKHLQTMYRYYYAGTTNKRTLEEGDIAGEWQDAAVSLRDTAPLN